MVQAFGHCVLQHSLLHNSKILGDEIVGALAASDPGKKLELLLINLGAQTDLDQRCVYIYIHIKCICLCVLVCVPIQYTCNLDISIYLSIHPSIHLSIYLF